MTIKELAQLAGVSTSTVSKVMNQKDEGISAGLRRIYESVLGEVRKGSSLSAALEAQQGNTATALILLSPPFPPKHL